MIDRAAREAFPLPTPEEIIKKDLLHVKRIDIINKYTAMLYADLDLDIKEDIDFDQAKANAFIDDLVGKFNDELQQNSGYWAEKGLTEPPPLHSLSPLAKKRFVYEWNNAYFEVYEREK